MNKIKRDPSERLAIREPFTHPLPTHTRGKRRRKKTVSIQNHFHPHRLLAAEKASQLPKNCLTPHPDRGVGREVPPPPLPTMQTSQPFSLLRFVTGLFALLQRPYLFHPFAWDVWTPSWAEKVQAVQAGYCKDRIFRSILFRPRFCGLLRGHQRLVLGVLGIV